MWLGAGAALAFARHRSVYAQAFVPLRLSAWKPEPATKAEEVWSYRGGGWLGAWVGLLVQSRGEEKQAERQPLSRPPLMAMLLSAGLARVN